MVGICSYLLVNFWYTRIAANQSSISALLTNRVGDCFLTIGILAVLWAFGNIDYATVFSLAPYISENIITMIGICLLIGAMAKSSQWGLVRALKFMWFFAQFFRTLQNAGNISNALESTSSNSEKSPKSFDLEKFQRQGINQQDLNKLNTMWIIKKLNELSPEFLEWFVGFTEGKGSFYIERGKSCFVIHLHFSDLPVLIEIKTQLNIGAVWRGKSLMCLKLSNSGDFLKRGRGASFTSLEQARPRSPLQIPSHLWKWVGGWINHSCTVISQKIIEIAMEYRGSKSIAYLVLVSFLVSAFFPYISFILSLPELHFNELLFSNSILLAIFPCASEASGFNSLNCSSAPLCGAEPPVYPLMWEIILLTIQWFLWKYIEMLILRSYK